MFGWKTLIGLISREEQEKLLKQLKAYYEKLYPDVKFEVRETVLSKEEVGEVLYTYQGEEIEATTDIKIQLIAEAVTRGYDTPAIILRKTQEKKDILLDGHRRLLYAFHFGLPWKAFILTPDKEVSFGVEKTIKGKVKELEKTITSF